MFTNAIGEIFFNHALKVSEKMKEVGKANFESSMIPETAPWEELNNLFGELNFNYRFKSNYEIVGVEINEQPRLFATQIDGSIDIENPRSLADLSDGEKTVISQCFASLRGSINSTKKLIIFDEIDAVLNPSLIETLFGVIKRYFLDKGISVIMTTHSPATIALSPDYTRYYEVFRRNCSGKRILEVNRDEYSELQVANKEFYDKIRDQNSRIKFLEGKIDSTKEILIITEGKTDWKYIISALRYFQSKGEFDEIKESYFYRYGSIEDVKNLICGTDVENELSDSKLRNYLNSLVESRRIDNSQIANIRIGIFDSDNKNIKTVNEEALGVHSFKISPENISTEFLFSDNEIKTEISGKRMYIGEEFDVKSKINVADNELNIGGNSQNTNKAGKRVIVDSGVYNRSRKNVALPKELFAQAVYNGEIEILEDSWQNFRHIFEKINESVPIQSAEETN